MKDKKGRKLFSMLINPDFAWKIGIVAAHEQKKKKDLILELLEPYINQKYNAIFVGKDPQDL